MLPGRHRLRPGVSQQCPAVPRLQALALGESWVPTVPTLLHVSRVTSQNCPQCPELPRVGLSPGGPHIDTQRLRATLSTSVHQDHSAPRPACGPGLSAMLAHRERTGRTHRGQDRGSTQAPFQEGALGSPPQKRPSGPPPSHGGAPGPSPPGGQSLTQVLLRSPAAWPLRVFTPLPQLWGLGHPRQPWYPGPQQGPQKPVGPVGSTFWCVHSLPLPAVTLSLSARGTGPRLGQRFRAALTKLLSWEQAACQISGPALV